MVCVTAMANSRTLPGVLAAIGLLTSTSTALAQFTPISGTPYQRMSETISYQPLTGQTNLDTDDDDGEWTVQLPFPFRYFSDTYNEVLIGTNGAVGFLPDYGSTAVSTVNPTLGSSGSPDAFIAPFWDDLRLYTADMGWVAHKTEGTAPQRRFIIEWHNVSRCCTAGDRLNMRVVLHEGAAARFDLEYGTYSGSLSYSATIGFESKSSGGSVASHDVLGCGTSCSSQDFTTGLTNRRYTFTQDPGVELVAVGVAPPQFMFEGSEALIPVTVQSLHGNPIGPYEVAVFGDTDPDFGNPVELGRTTATNGPYQLLEVLVPARARAADGFPVGARVYLSATVDVDRDITEVNENNNVVAERTGVLLLQSRPDARIEQVRLSTSAVDAGDTLDVYATVSNAGGLPTGPFQLAAMLSSNPVISPSDDDLGRTSLNLESGEVVTATLSVTISPNINSGSYYIGALADPEGLIEELDEGNNGLAAFRPLVVTGGSVGVISTRLPDAVVGTTYSSFLRAAGGSGRYTWRISAGQLPAGLSLASENGEVFGRPSAAGCETFTAEVNDGNGTATKQLELCAVVPTLPLTIVNRALPGAVTGQEYTFTLIATGGAESATLEWSSANMPEGFQLTSEGIITGSTLLEGAYGFGVQVTDGTNTANRDFELLVESNDNLQIVPEPLTVGDVGVSYTHQLKSTGGIEPIIWTQSGTTLDTVGLDLDASGLITGIPVASGTFRITVQARDSGPIGAAARDEDTFTLVVNADSSLSIVTETLPIAYVGVGFDRSIAAAGGSPSYEWRLEGRLPEGLAWDTDPDANELRIIGTPEEVALATVVVSATDREGRHTMKAFTVDVRDAPPIEAPVDPNSCTHSGTSSEPGLALLALFGLVFGLRRRRR